MWPKRKKRNRRVEHEHVLEVKMRSRQLRALRVRLVAKLFALVFGTLAALFVLWKGGDWLLNELVLKNPAFAVREIAVETDGIIPPHQLRTCAGVHIGDNLLALDLSRIRRDLEYLPWVRSAAVERVRPHQLRIRISEREPIARTTLYQPLSAGSGSSEVVFYFDAEGFVMLPLEIHRVRASALGLDALPLIAGVSGADLRPGHRTESPQIQAALRLLIEFNRSPMLGLVDLTSIDLSLPELLQVTTGQGAEIVLATDGLARQLRRWRLVYDYALRHGKALAWMDLSVANNVPARWLETAAIPPVQPPPLRPSPYRRKKHV